MTGLILRRLVQLPVILLVIYTITLTLAWMIPGNPLENPEGRRPSPEVAEQMLRQYDLDSFPRFYTSFLDRVTGLRWARDTLSGRAAETARQARDAGTEPPHRRVVVPEHKEIAKGTIRAILRQTGITKEELVELLR